LLGGVVKFEGFEGGILVLFHVHKSQ